MFRQNEGTFPWKEIVTSTLKHGTKYILDSMSENILLISKDFILPWCAEYS